MRVSCFARWSKGATASGPPYAKGPMPAGVSALAAGPVGAAMQLFLSTMSKIERRHHVVENDGQRGKFHIKLDRNE